MRNSKAWMIAAALGVGLAFGATPAETKTAPVQRITPRVEAKRRRLVGSQWGSVFFTKRGPGWTAAHVQRMARKHRNQLRHKRAVRRARCRP
ncbi:MAG: hypothetical protein J0H72_25310 [Burkholderiales bacterium]|nr:hypothetical protein [Burkholderiales bacterium]